MWNCCLRNNQVSAQDEEVDQKIETISSCGIKKNKKNKKVRFKIEDGAVRIRVVVTKEELKRMLRNNRNHENDSDSDDQHSISLEQLLNDMVLRDKRVFEIGKNGGTWRPALESIPEDCSMK